MKRSTFVINGRLFLSAICLWIFLFVLGCRKAFQLDTPDRSATAVFNDLWKFIDEHYALFEVKNVDWAGVRQRYANLVKNEMSEQELFEVCADMLEELRDGHVSLSSSVRTATYENFYRLFPANFNYAIVEEQYLRANRRTAGAFIYAKDQDIGYIYVRSFGDAYTDEDLESVFSELADVKGFIIDVRDNSGGTAVNVNRLTSKLLSAKRIVKYELVKSGPGQSQFNPPVPFYLSPSGVIINKPVVLLTNRKCFSACNDFVSYLKGQVNVTVIGDRTGGGGGVPANFVLVNGWKLQYTSTITWSAQKLPIEEGIVPDIAINISPIDEANKRDPILERAILLIR